VPTPVDITFHFPPELMALLIDAIPRLCRSKRDVLLFFKGAGVAARFTQDIQARLAADHGAVNKFDIVRTVLTRLSERGESGLRERREILKRVMEFEDFSTCWPKDRLEAKGLVAEIQRVVNVKDSFTRMAQERETEARKRREEADAKAKAIQAKKQELQKLRDELFALFALTDPWARGKKLESVLNQLFKASGMLVSEAFTLTGDESQGVVEQVDGVLKIDGDLYLVEMKWWDERLGPGEVAQHQVRVFTRGHVRGIFISASGYTDAAIQTCREALPRAFFVLCELEEIVHALESDMPLTDLFKRKIDGLLIGKQPLTKVL
jgi:restriction system protein